MYNKWDNLHINLDELLLHMNGSLNSMREENDNLFIWTVDKNIIILYNYICR